MLCQLEGVVAVGDDGCQLQVRGFRRMPGAHAAQDQNAHLGQDFPQGDGLIHVRHGKPAHALLPGLHRHHVHAVPIGVGLDHEDDFRTGPDGRAQQLEVAAQDVGLELNPCVGGVGVHAGCGPSLGGWACGGGGVIFTARSG